MIVFTVQRRRTEMVKGDKNLNNAVITTEWNTEQIGRNETKAERARQSTITEDKKKKKYQSKTYDRNRQR